MRDADREAFGRVYDEQVWRVYGFFGYRVNNRADVEDLTQQTFERALKAWHRFDPSRASPSTWLLSIARNLLVDHYRQDRSALHRPIEEAERHAGSITTPGPEDGLGLDPVLAGALDKLGERQREIIALKYGGDLTGPEIAGITGLSLSNVQQILSRALRGLAREIADRGRVRV